MNRNVALDFLRITLACMVVGLHAGFLCDITSIGYYLTVNGIFRIAVPVFILINGFYFFPVISKGRTFSWYKRILFLYSFWMLFYSYFWFTPNEIFSGRMARIVIFGYLHLWYLPGILGASVLVMLLKDISLRIMIPGIIFVYFVGIVIQYMGNYQLVEDPLIAKWLSYTWIDRNFFFFAFPFFYIGFILNKYHLHEKLSFKWSLAIAFISFLFLLIESLFNFINSPSNAGFDMFASLLLVCPSVFLLFVNIEYYGQSKGVALFSTGVYFIHKIFLIVLSKFTDFDKTLLTLIVIILSIISSFFLIEINKRIKFIL